MIPLGVTPCQARLLGFIQAELRAGRPSPTIAEMATHMGKRSKGHVHAMVVALEERGHIARLPNRNRSIVLTEEAAAYTVRLSRFADRRLQDHVAAWGSTPETVIAQAVEEYLGRRA